MALPLQLPLLQAIQSLAKALEDALCSYYQEEWRQMENEWLEWEEWWEEWERWEWEEWEDWGI